MNPADPNAPATLTGAQRARVLVVVVLLLFVLEKVVEKVATAYFGETARLQLERVDASIRRTLNQLSPWFVFQDFVAALGGQPHTSAAGETSTSANGSPGVPHLESPAGFVSSTSPLGSIEPGAGAQYAKRLAEEQRRTDEQARAEEQRKADSNPVTQNEAAAVSSVNPLLLPFKAPGVLVTVIVRAATRGPGHFIVAMLALVGAWSVVRPDAGWRWWLLILVPVVAAALVAGLYLLCQAASLALHWALWAPSIPVIVGTAFSVIKIPTNMAIEKRVHGGVVRLIRLFRR